MLLWVESVDQSEASTSERESSAGLHGMTAGEKNVAQRIVQWNSDEDSL